MTEALRAVLRYGFEEMGLNRIQALIDSENMRSIKLVERLGFEKEGDSPTKQLLQRAIQRRSMLFTT